MTAAATPRIPTSATIPQPMAIFAPVVTRWPPDLVDAADDVREGAHAGQGGARALAKVGRTGYDARSASIFVPEARGGGALEPTWHDGLSRKALVELVEALLMAVDKSIPRLDAVAHHLSLMTQQGE